MSLLMHARMSAGGGTGSPHSSAATAAAAAAAAHAQAQAQAQVQAQASYLSMANMAALMQASAPGCALLMPHWAATAARFMPYGSVGSDESGRPSVLCRPKPMKLTADKDAHAALAALWASRKSDSGGSGSGSASAAAGANGSGAGSADASAAASMTAARQEPAESRWKTNTGEAVCC
jgi:hypothetical protein